MRGAGRLHRAFAGAALACFVAVLGDPAPAVAASFDCAKAATRSERAICASPDLAAADGEMGEAYRALRALLPPKQRPGLARDQQAWLRSRDRNCRYDGSAAGFAKCLLFTTGFRTKFLSATSVTTANGTRIAPNLFHEDRAGAYRITAIYPVAESGDPAAAARFNHAAYQIAIGSRDLKRFRTGNRPSIPNTFSESYKLVPLGHNLVSVLFRADSYSGGAHGISDRTALLFDVADGRQLGLKALLNDPARALPAISQLCAEKLRAKAAREGWAEMLWIDDPKMHADPLKEISQVENWFVRPDGVDILFGEYTIGPYAIGLHECRLSDAELAPWINKDGPLAALAK